MPGSASNAFFPSMLLLPVSPTHSKAVDLSAIDANANSAGNQAFIYIGTALFSGVAGQIATRSSAGGTLVIADTDGDRAADFALFVNGSTLLTADCFVL